MMKRVCDVPEVLVQEIFSKVPLTSLSKVRSACKTWNTLSQHQNFAITKNQSLGFTVINSRLFSLKFDLRDEGDLVSLSIKGVSMFNHVVINNVLHCDGLMLCIINNNRWRVVWNPYLGEIRWIEPIHELHEFQKSDMFAFGYDNNRNHKILRFLNVFESSELPEFFEIYEFSSNSWRVLDIVPNFKIKREGVSLKGNTYFFARIKTEDDLSPDGEAFFLLCFDFSSERFGLRLSLPYKPFLPFLECETLSSVRDEHLAVLFQSYDSVTEIWITTEIEPNRVSWSSFFKVDLKPFPERIYAESLFVYEEKKVAMVVNLRRSKVNYKVTTCIIGEDENLKSVRLREAPDLSSTPSKFRHHNPLLVCSYVPSLVPLHIN